VSELQLEQRSSYGNNNYLNAGSPPAQVRHHLPDERESVTHKFTIGAHEGYITVGLYPDRQPGEIFVIMAKEGSTLAGMMDSFAISVSLALQHGVPLKLLCEKFSHTRFEPSGWTHNPEFGYAHSVMDYLFRWLRFRFIDRQPPINTESLALNTSPVGNESFGQKQRLQSVIFTLQYCLETLEQACQCGRCDPCTRGQEDITRAIRIIEDFTCSPEPPNQAHVDKTISCAPGQNDASHS
jgi:hypothetical protein